MSGGKTAGEALQRSKNKRALQELSGQLELLVASCTEVNQQVRDMPVIDGEQARIGDALREELMGTIEQAQSLNYRLEVFYEKGIL